MQKYANVRFNAFAYAGTATSAKVIYANYGRLEDFDYIEKQLNLSLNGSIVLIRYGKLWRGAKVKNAQDKGALGVLLYSDPADCSKNLTSKEKTFPHSILMPADGVQRGAISQLDLGDQLTPLLPAKEFVIRRTVDSLYESGRLCTIPVTPISYSDAYKILSRLSGVVAPTFWQGGFNNITYKVGPSLDKPNESLRLVVTTYLANRKISNVIGYIKGDVEPDRYVIIGNHHDSWVYGGIDPSSGTATLLEVARAFKAVSQKSSWKPRRTIMFCAWDAEEYGIVGSSEYVEQYLRRLESKAVAYLNVDMAVSGKDTIWAQSVPLLQQVLYESAKLVPNPDEQERRLGRITVFDTWKYKLPNMDIPDLPWIGAIGSGSDYRHFLDYAGIPSLDFRYANAKDRSFPLYHTIHETAYLVKNFMDPNFAIHKAVGQMWGQMALSLTSNVIIPFNVSDYSNALKEYINNLERTVLKKYSLLNANISVIRDAYPFFENATKVFNDQVQIFKENTFKKPHKTKSINDRLQYLERMFIVPGGIPERPYLRHVVFAPSVYNSYSGVTFAGVLDTLDRMLQVSEPSDLKRLRIILNDQISWVANCIRAASDHLLSDW